MRTHQARSGGEGLERSCRRPGEGWIVSRGPAEGVELFSAWFAGRAYERHRHDTYAIGLTDRGVQMFDYRGAARTSLPGEVVTLYPDEPHDGRAGTRDGFGYRIVYVQPARLSEALRVLRGKPSPLPFLREPVCRQPQALSRRRAGLRRAARIARGRQHRGRARRSARRRRAAGWARRASTRAAVDRARQMLDAECTRAVHSRELESVTGLSRYDLARQFRALLGTSPHRYLLMRRLDFARKRIQQSRRLVDVACDAGFADQAHFTRTFKAAFGLTPARYRALSAG